jgi:hypothetical protein
MKTIENYCQESSYFRQNVVKTIVLNKVWWVEWDKIFHSITSVEKLNTFTESTYTYWTRRDSESHQ